MQKARFPSGLKETVMAKMAQSHKWRAFRGFSIGSDAVKACENMDSGKIAGTGSED
jgi:hypothetical protein